MPITRCPNCRTELDVDPKWIGRTIRCSECQTEFAATLPVRARPAAPRDEEPPRSRRRDDDEDDRPRRRRMRDEDDFDDRPRRRPKKKSGGSAVLIVLLVIGGLVLLGCGGGGFWIYQTVNAPITFDPSAWKEHSIADGSCSAMFPGTPILEPIGGGFGVSGNKHVYNAGGMKDAAMLLGHIDYSNPDAGVFDRACQLERDEVKSAIDGRVVREVPIMVQGYQAKEIEFEAHGVTIVYRLVHMPDRFKTRIVLLMASGRNLSAADRTKFLESFRVKAKK